MSRRKIGAGISLALAAGSLSLMPFTANAETSSPFPAATDTDALVAIGSDTTYLAVAKVADKWNLTSPANLIASYDPYLTKYTQAPDNANNACYLVRTATNSGSGHAAIPDASPAVGIADGATVSFYAKRSDTSGSGGARKALWADADSADALTYYSDATCTTAYTKAAAAIDTLDTTTGSVIDFGRASSWSAPGNNDQDLTYFPFAYDALVPAVSGHVASYAPATLTKDQLVGIYTGTITNWKQVGGADATIKAYLPDTNSGTRNDWISSALGITGTYVAPSTVHIAEEHSKEPIMDDPAAVEPMSIGRAALFSSDVKILGGSTYKFERIVYNVVRTSDNALGYVDSLFDATTTTGGFTAGSYFCDAAQGTAIGAGGLYQLTSSDCGKPYAGTTKPAPALMHGTGPGDAVVYSGYVAPVIVVDPPATPWKAATTTFTGAKAGKVIASKSQAAAAKILALKKTYKNNAKIKGLKIKAVKYNIYEGKKVVGTWSITTHGDIKITKIKLKKSKKAHTLKFEIDFQKAKGKSGKKAKQFAKTKYVAVKKFKTKKY